jgi:uncharacterized protein YcfL
MKKVIFAMLSVFVLAACTTNETTVEETTVDSTEVVVDSSATGTEVEVEATEPVTVAE